MFHIFHLLGTPYFRINRHRLSFQLRRHHGSQCCLRFFVWARTPIDRGNHHRDEMWICTMVCGHGRMQTHTVGTESEGDHFSVEVGQEQLEVCRSWPYTERTSQHGLDSVSTCFGNLSRGGFPLALFFVCFAWPSNAKKPKRGADVYD